DRLRQDLSRMETVLAGHREAEKNLQATMTTAQKLSDDLKAGADMDAKRIANAAEAEAKRIVQDAEARSAMIIEKAQARPEDIQREIDGLKLKRKDVETTIEATMQALRNTLDFIREQETREREERTLHPRPRLVE